MKGRRILYALAAVVLFAGCFKKVSYETEYVLKPQVQELSGDPTTPVAGVKAYAFNVDTSLYTVASYEDALNGMVSLRANPSEKISTPSAVGEPYEREGAEGWVRMTLSQPTQMVVVVEPSRRLYAYTQQQLSETLSTLYISVIFKPWKEGTYYAEGNWRFYNEFYTDPSKLDCYINPSVQLAEDAEPTPIETLKIYAYAVDTASWYLRSYDDAVSGVLTSKSDTTVTRSNPNFQAYLDSGSGLYKMEVSASPLMLVVVDRTDRLYAYSQREIDLSGTSPTYPLVFRPWKQLWIERDETDGWTLVNPAYAPANP